MANTHICAECDVRFRKNRGLNQHFRSCYLQKKITDAQTPYERNEGDAKDQTSDDSNIEITETSTPSLRYKWGFCLQKSGQVGKSFIDEISRLVNEWIHESPFTETLRKIEIKRSLEIIGKPNEAMACRRNHGVVERSRDHSERLKSI